MMIELSSWDTLVYTVVVLCLMVLLTKLLVSSVPSVRLRDNKNGHRWNTGQGSLLSCAPALHCNSCENLLVASLGQAVCLLCGATACAVSKCIRTVDRKISCKAVSKAKNVEEARLKTEKGSKHKWLAGNLPSDAICSVCEEPAGDGPGIRDLKCIWCHRNIHTECQVEINENCDFGEHRDFIVPPERVISKPTRGRRGRVISRLHLPENTESFHPLIVVGNKKSGNNDGNAVLAAFRRHLNPAQVIDLAESRMEEAVEWCVLASPATCYIVVCGGDGTIGWLLNTADKMKLDTHPAVAIFPLGTGNDLSRTLGYGSGSDSSDNVSEYMNRLARAETVPLDRWRVEVVPRRHLRIRLPTSTILLNNYLSIGVDALVTFNFHKARESPFYIMPSRVINKLIYFSYGTKDVLERQCQTLNKKLELYMDGKKIELPEIESVVILNIPYWGAGVRPWELGSGHQEFNFQPNFSDKKLEVFCLYSSFHIAQMQVGLSEPHRVGQAREIRIKLAESVPMQIDGEPWEQHPADISLRHHGQVPMLSLPVF